MEGTGGRQLLGRGWYRAAGWATRAEAGTERSETFRPTGTVGLALGRRAMLRIIRGGLHEIVAGLQLHKVALVGNVPT